MNIAGNTVQEILKRWVKVKRKDVVAEVIMEDFDYILVIFKEINNFIKFVILQKIIKIEIFH